MHRISSEDELKIAVEHIVRVEPRFGAVVEQHGLPPLRLVHPRLESLLRIVTEQLISLRAGEAIWKRIEARLAPFDPDDILALSEEDLRALGLSGAKARTFLAAATAAREGLFDHSRTDLWDDRLIHTELTKIAGIGPWTAEIYLLSAMGRSDAWPSGDLALQVAAQDLLGLKSRPDAKVMRTISECWKPYRAAAARLLWCHYRGLKGMTQIVI